MRNDFTKTFKTSRGPVEITLTQLGGVSAGKEVVRLAPIIPPIIGAFFPKGLPKLSLKGFDAKETVTRALLADIDLTAVGAALMKLDADQFALILANLCKGTAVIPAGDASGEFISQPLNVSLLEDLFRGEVWELFRLAGFALSVNYFSFLPDHSVNG